MKNIQILTYPRHIDQVLSSLSSLGLSNILCTEVKQFGPSSRAGVYRGRPFEIRFESKVKIEFNLPEWRAREVIDLMIEANNRTPGADIKVVVLSIEDALSCADAVHTADHV